MNIILPITDYNINHVQYGEKIKNTVIWNSFFIKILYSTGDIILSGLFFDINLINKKIYKENSKYKIIFDVKKNSELVNKIEQIEKTILHKVNIINKTPRQSIYEQFKNGYLKLNCLCDNNYKIDGFEKCILKISGVWENSSEYGITFKLFISNHQSNSS